MSATFRTTRSGRIDRTKPLRFVFDGRSYSGFVGDTLASALLANGVHLMGRSYKYHRPRGVLGAGAEEPNALVAVSRGGGRFTPNLRATQVELYDGLVAQSQNRWPSLKLDVGALNSLAPNGLFSAGFYYKTFMAPKAAWKHVFEPVIRQMAGLGTAPDAPDPDHYTQIYAFCDVLIVGAGLAGLREALAAAKTDARVILCDEQAEPGGFLLDGDEDEIDGLPAAEWLANTLATLQAAPNVTLLMRTQAFGYYAQNFVALAERISDHVAAPAADLPRERLWKVRAKHVVLATGAIERPLVFPDNDRPGIMLAHAAQSYAMCYGVKPGTRALVFTACDSAYRSAHLLHQAGIEIAAIVDLREKPHIHLIAAAEDAGMRVITSATITGTQGTLRVSAADIGVIQHDGSVTGLDRISCDLIAISGGWTPSVHLFSQSRGKLRWDEALQAYIPGEAVQDQRSVGACAGDLPEAMRSGFSGACPHGRDPAKVKAFVDFQNDVCAADIDLAVQEGMRSIEHVKRYTTTGMATDQGKTSNINGLAIAAHALKKPIPEVGLTTFRPPYTPVTFGTLAGHARGDLFDPTRKTPLHDRAEALGAVFEDVGLWKRARYFPKAGENMAKALARECKAVRETCGIFDASTLGKIEVCGPDAARFLNWIYTNPMLKLEVGRLRYCILLNEAGFVSDDGVIARLAEDRFHVTTTSGGAPRVLAHMEDYLQTEFPEMKVWLTSTTEQWAVIAVQGPQARNILSRLVDDIDISANGMPHMSVREGHINGVPVRLFRVSFTGELGYEINVPAAYAQAMWDAVMEVGTPFGLKPYGLEAAHVLRAEKGYIITGLETDGTVTPHDLGLDWAIGKAKANFVGKRSLSRPDMLKADRKQLVGLVALDPSFQLDEGAQVVGMANPPAGTPALGHVTSSYRSAHLGHAIALALVSGGRARTGETLHVTTDKETVPVRVVDPVFIDKDGARLEGSDAAAHHPNAAARQLLAASSLSLPAKCLDTRDEDTPIIALPDQPARFILRGSAARQAASDAVGLEIPTQPCRAVEANGIAALWLGPDEWLLLANRAVSATVRTKLAPALTTIPHALVEVSERQASLMVEGDGVEHLLNGGVPLDLSLGAFPVGMVVRTIFEKSEIMLWRRSETRFQIEVLRSFLPYVATLLADMRRENAALKSMGLKN